MVHSNPPASRDMLADRYLLSLVLLIETFIGMACIHVSAQPPVIMQENYWDS